MTQFRSLQGHGAEHCITFSPLEGHFIMAPFTIGRVLIWTDHFKGFLWGTASHSLHQTGSLRHFIAFFLLYMTHNFRWRGHPRRHTIMWRTANSSVFASLKGTVFSAMGGPLPPWIHHWLATLPKPSSVISKEQDNFNTTRLSFMYFILYSVFEEVIKWTIFLKEHSILTLCFEHQ